MTRYSRKQSVREELDRINGAEIVNGTTNKVAKTALKGTEVQH